MTPDVSDDALRAIAHPGRRAMLRLVWDEERAATELADAAGMSKSAASQHLKLLRDAGGVVRWTQANGDTCWGEYVKLVPASRVVFTYGWERADVEIPPGSTTVEIDLTATTETTTLLRLVHRGLDDLAAGAHHGDWLHNLDRLRRRAEGSPPGQDPFAGNASRHRRSFVGE